MGAFYPIIHYDFRCRRPDLDAHQMPPCGLAQSWFCKLESMRERTAPRGGLRSPIPCEIPRQVSNLRVSQSSWDCSSMELVACLAMGQKRTLFTVPLYVCCTPKADISNRAGWENTEKGGFQSGRPSSRLLRPYSGGRMGRANATPVP